MKKCKSLHLICPCTRLSQGVEWMALAISWLNQGILGWLEHLRLGACCLKHCVVVVCLVIAIELPNILHECIRIVLNFLWTFTFEVMIVWGSEISKRTMLWSEKSLSTLILGIIFELAL